LKKTKDTPENFFQNFFAIFIFGQKILSIPGFRKKVLKKISEKAGRTIMVSFLDFNPRKSVTDSFLETSPKFSKNAFFGFEAPAPDANQ
jgi:hypothetical protein